VSSSNSIDTRLGEYEILEESGNHRFTRAIAAAGRFHSGQYDVSTEHDHYLAEAYDRHFSEQGFERIP